MVTLFVLHHRIFADIGLAGVDEDVEGTDVGTTHQQCISKVLVVPSSTKLKRVSVKVARRLTLRIHSPGYRIRRERW